MNKYFPALIILLLTIIFILSINNFSTSVYVKTSYIGGTYGRGVFSNKFYYPGEIIEVAPCISEYEPGGYNKSIQSDYVYTSSEDNWEKKHYCFGFASIYNHSDNPNAEWSIRGSNNIIKAIKLIKPGDEITHSYGEDYWKSREGQLEKKDNE